MPSLKPSGSAPRTLDADPPRLTSVTPEMDRYNGRLYLFSYVLIFFCGPIDYVGVVQASLCNRLGASHMIANLPAAAYSLGNIVPFVLASFVPYRYERAVMVLANLVTALSTGIVCIALFLPCSSEIRIAAVIVQGAILGFSACTADVYTFQCLGRASTEKGRAQIYKIAFTIGPIMGIVGSLLSQFVLNGGILSLHFPNDFGFLYLICLPSMGGVALLSSRYKMIWLEERERPPILRSMVQGVKNYCANRDLVILWLAYLFWYFSINGAANLSLFSQQAVGRSPSTLAGTAMALTFLGKSVGGFILGAVDFRYESFAASKVAIILAGGALLWAAVTPGYPYLIAFAFVGAGALGGVYIPNSVLCLSAATRSTSDLAILSLTRPLSGIAPVIYGALADRLGFRASFAFGIVTALIALWLLSGVSAKAPQLAADTGN